MPKVDPAALPRRTGTIYPDKYAHEVAGRSSVRVGAAGGLTQFGANIVTLAPGAAGSLRHWHVKEDEFLIVLEGTLTLIEDEGETVMVSGDCACFPAGIANGHHMVNRSPNEGRFLVVGTSAKDETAYYADHDLMVRLTPQGPIFTHKDGSPLATAKDSD